MGIIETGKEIELEFGERKFIHISEKIEKGKQDNEKFVSIINGHHKAGGEEVIMNIIIIPDLENVLEDVVTLLSEISEDWKTKGVN